MLFILGLGTSIVGWFFDRALQIPAVTKTLAPDYFFGNQGLETLEQNERVAITKANPAFSPLLARWPNLSDKTRVEFIGRSAAFLGFGPTVQSDVELIPYDADRKPLDPRWRVSAARSELRRKAEGRVFWYGTCVFFVGIGLTACSGFLEFHRDQSV